MIKFKENKTIYTPSLLQLRILTVLFVLVIFWPAASFDFLHWDDRLNIVDNPYLSPHSSEKILKLWKEPYRKLYIPLTYTLWSGVSRLSGELNIVDDSGKISPLLFHCLNISIHIFNTLLILTIIKELLKKLRTKDNDDASVNIAAAFGAVLFAIHPVQIEPVVWITGTKDLLSGCLLLMSAYLYILYLKKSSVGETGPLRFDKKHYAPALLFFTLSILAKPSSVITPVILLIISTKAFNRKIIDSIKNLLPWIVMAFLFAIFNISLQPDRIMEFIPPLPARPLIALDAITFYIFKLIMPLSLTPDYGRTPEYILTGPWLFFTPLAAIALIIGIFITGQRIVTISLLIFITALSPVLGLIPFPYQEISTTADRYLYISMLGVSLTFAWFCLVIKKSNRYLTPSLMITLLGVISLVQVKYWENDITLFTNASKLNTKSYKARNILGIAYASKRDYYQSESRLREALKIKPDYREALNNLGITLTEQRKFTEASTIFTALINEDPTEYKACYNLGLVYNKMALPEKASLYFKKAIAINPSFVKAYINLASLMASHGKEYKAITYFKKALSIDRDNEIINYNLGILMADSGKHKEAIEYYLETIRLKPNSYLAYNNLAASYASTGDFDNAIKNFKNALSLKPDFLEARNNLQKALKELQDR